MLELFWQFWCEKWQNYYCCAFIQGSHLLQPVLVVQGSKFFAKLCILLWFSYVFFLLARFKWSLTILNLPEQIFQVWSLNQVSFETGFLKKPRDLAGNAGGIPGTAAVWFYLHPESTLKACVDLLQVVVCFRGMTRSPGQEWASKGPMLLADNCFWQNAF